MKRFFKLFLGLTLMSSISSCSSGTILSSNLPQSNVSNGSSADNDFHVSSNILVAFFSRTNTTETIAKYVQEETKADIFEIERKEAYPNDYNSTTEVARVEKNNDARPELKTYLPNDVVSQYKTIFLGFPIWWSSAPMPVLTFLNYYDFIGTTIYTFVTSGSSSISGSTPDVRSNAKGATVIEERRFNANDQSGVKSWISSLNLDIKEETNKFADEKVLVTYFSASGNTKRIGGLIQQLTDANVFEVEPKIPYTSADLNYSNPDSRVSKEHDDPSLRNIELVKTTPDGFYDYTVVFIGYPIWWGIAAWPIYNFVKDNDFTNKTIIPFATSASSGLGNSATSLQQMNNTGTWTQGQRFSSSASLTTVKSFVDSIQL